jgi:hypothetical protein
MGLGVFSFQVFGFKGLTGKVLTTLELERFSWGGFEARAENKGLTTYQVTQSLDFK